MENFEQELVQPVEKSLLQKIENLVARDPFFWRLLMLKNAITGIPEAPDYRRRQYFLHGGYAVPLVNDNQHPKFFSNLRAFINSSSFLTMQVWPIALLAMQVHDLVLFCTEPTMRGKATLGKIFAGIAQGRYSYSSQWWGDFPGTKAYGLVPLLLGVGMPLTALAYTLWNHICIQEVNPKTFLGKKYQQLWQYRGYVAIDAEGELITSNNLGRIEAWIKNIDKVRIHSDVLASFKEAALNLFSRGVLSNSTLESLHTNSLNTLRGLSLGGNIYADYALWSLGYDMPPNYKFIKRVSFWVMDLYKYYALVRLFELWVFKLFMPPDVVKMSPIGMDALEYECIQQGKIWSYLAELGGEFCSVCPQERIYLGWIFTQADCFKGLMALSKSPTELMSGFSSLNYSSNTLDFTQQAWPAWDDAEFDTVLSLLEDQNPGGIKAINFSRPISAAGVSSSKVKRLAEFIGRAKPKHVFLRNLGLALEQMKELALPLADVVSLDLFGNSLRDQGVSVLFQTLSPNVTQVLNLGHNDLAKQPRLQNKSALVVFQANENSLDDNAFIQLGIDLPATAIQTLVLDNTDASFIGMNALVKSITNSSVHFFSVANNPMSRGVFVASIGQLAESNVTEYNLQGMGLNDDFLVMLAENWPFSNPIRLNIENNKFTDQGLLALADLTKTGRLLEVKLGHQIFSHATWLIFFEAILGSSLQELSITNSKITDSELFGLAQIIGNYTSLSSLALRSNRFSAAGASALLSNVTHSSLITLDLSDNNLANQTNTRLALLLGDLVQQGPLSTLILECTRLGDEVGVALADALPGSYIKALGFRGNRLSGVAAMALAERLIISSLSSTVLSQPFLSLLQAKELSSANASASLKQLDVRDNLIDDQGARALCRVLPRTQIEFSTDWLEGNGLISNQNLDVEACRVLPYNSSVATNSSSFWNQRASHKLTSLSVESKSQFEFNVWMQLTLLGVFLLLLAKPTYKRAKTYFQDIDNDSPISSVGKRV